MDFNTFLDHFDTITKAPSGIAKLKALILDLAVRGKLVPQNPEDESALDLIDLLREWQIRGFKLLETRAKNRFTQEVY